MVPCLRQCNKELHAFAKHLSSNIDMQYTWAYMCARVNFHIPTTHVNENKRTQHFCSPTEKQLHVELSIFVSLAANFLIAHPVFVTTLLPPPTIYLSYFIKLLLRPNWKLICCNCYKNPPIICV